MIPQRLRDFDGGNLRRNRHSEVQQPSLKKVRKIYINIDAFGANTGKKSHLSTLSLAGLD
jgi:hypothetical protein